jgi:acetoacetyl-[acyl-carrier protein] synthase
VQRIPVIVGFGGINAAGRASFHQAFNRLVYDALDTARQQELLLGLATLTGRLHQADGHWVDPAGNALAPADATARLATELLDGTCVRRIPPTLFDVDAIPVNRRVTLGNGAAPLEFTLRRRDLPARLPDNWQLSGNGDMVSVRVAGGLDALLPDTRRSAVSSAGVLPDGFDPHALYSSHHHPRALAMAVFAASDALGCSGLDWETLRDRLPPDQVAVYASSAMSQLDDAGFGGMMKAGSNGRRTTSKQCPLGFGEMPADFINAYVLGSVGATGGMLGACATFLYNLELAVRDIRSGKRRLVMVGTSEAPVLPEVIEGYRAMGALGEDAALLALDPGRSTPDHRRACRPFGNNIGFTLAESAQYVLLMDDELALETGAQVFGAVPEVFVHADGYKRSISAPGAGNYLTMARAAGCVRDLLGEQVLRQHSFVHAHGTGTPQNRTTESHVLNETAKAFGIAAWPVTAIKCYLGHSIGSAGGDQLAAALGTFASGLLPGIFTLDAIAHDVHHSNLSLAQTHRQLPEADVALLNSKGFGGNNATAVAVSPRIVARWMRERHGAAAVTAWQKHSEQTFTRAQTYGARALAGELVPRYLFGEGVIDGHDVAITDRQVTLPGFARPVRLARDDD